MKESKNKKSKKMRAQLCLVLPFLFMQSGTTDLNLPQPNDKTKKSFGYLTNLTFQTEKNQSPTSHLSRYYFKPTNPSFNSG